MTNWLPNELPGSEPIYVRLANRLENDIECGRLPAGTKLPPLRNLAFDLGVTIGTISRAYAVARERGLVVGEVGRGTYVRHAPATGGNGGQLPRLDAGTHEAVAPSNVVRFDSSAAPMVGQADMMHDILAQIPNQHPENVASYTRALPDGWRQAGQRWLKSGNWTPDMANVVPTLGGHAAAIAAILAVTSPGDQIVLEELSYASIGRSATLLGRRVLTVATDQQGINTEELARICAQQHPRAVFLMPSLNNPTLAVLSAQRRSDLVAIARKHSLWLIEDGIYTSLVGDPHNSLAELAPDRTFSLGGMSKSVSAGVRGGWMACPPGFASRILMSHKLTTGGLPFFLSELAARMVNEGLADDIRQKVQAEIEARRAIALAGLDGFDVETHKHAPFIWVGVPEPWQPGTLKKAAENEGVLIDEVDEFRIGDSDRAIRRVRVGFTVPPSRADVERGIGILRTLLSGHSALYDTYS